MLKETLTKTKISLMKERNPENKVKIDSINEILTTLKSIAVREKKDVDSLTDVETKKAIQKAYNEALQEKDGLLKANRSVLEIENKISFLSEFLPKTKSKEEVEAEIKAFLKQNPDSKFVDLINYFKQDKESYDMALVNKLIKEVL